MYARWGSGSWQLPQSSLISVCWSGPWTPSGARGCLWLKRTCPGAEVADQARLVRRRGDAGGEGVEPDGGGERAGVALLTVVVEGRVRRRDRVGLIPVLGAEIEERDAEGRQGKEQRPEQRPPDAA